MEDRPSNSKKVDIESNDFRLWVFKMQKLSCGLTINGTRKIKSAVRLKDNSVPEIQPWNDRREEEIVSRSHLTETLINNGFNQASVKVLFPMVSSELSGSLTRINQNGAADQKSSFHHVIYHQQATIELTKPTVEPTEEFVNDIKTALRMNSPWDRYEALKGVFDTYGYVWAQKVALGGKLTASEKFEGHQTDHEKKTKALATAKANVDAVINGLDGTDVGFGFTVERERASSDASIYAYKTSLLKVQGEAKFHFGIVISGFGRHDGHFALRDRRLIYSIFFVSGGDSTANAFDRTRAGWEASLKSNPFTWQVIRHDELIPIYELLDENLLSQVKDVMERAHKTVRVTTSSELTIRNVETNHTLGWKQFYYGSTPGYAGMVVTTCPVTSGEHDNSIVWKFVKSPNNNDQGPYIHFGDTVYIQPAFIPGQTTNKLYLHGSYRNQAPVTKTAPEVSLRLFDKEMPNANDEWMVMACDDGDASADMDLDVSLYKSSYVTKDDRFKLRQRTTDKHYLASHSQTIENIYVRKKPNQANPMFSLHPPKLKEDKKIGPFANTFHEVLLLEPSQCGASKDIWEIFKKKQAEVIK
ncbi:hypothetical protein BC938DRAFT_479395 [Jimgerdemannia flammicorona]|uniref:MACPF-like domain-containing protein n=1 Tax=Jimgerdemannia flammicorona TaxID=994334 RepID=A0A433QKX8_9FUNG|nr:hypothetical protein BC938DRAFT_479395 [Jimgerdemannia flammicorona]